MRLYVAAPLTIIAGVGVVLSVIAWLAVSRSAETVQWTKQKEMTRVAGLVNDVLRSATRNAVSQAELVAGMPGVGAAMAREDRDWLKSVLPVFQQQRAKYGVEGVTFITPPAKTLLRLADPGRFGDDQSASRPLLLAASRLRESQGGVEISRTSIGLRGVAPAYDNGRAVGLVEWRVGLFGIAREMSDITDTDVTIFLNRDRVTGNRAAEERALGEVAALASTAWELTSGLLRAEDLKPVNAVKFEYRTWRKTDYAIVQVPLFDFSADRIGTIVAIAEANEFARAESANRAILTSAVIVGTLSCAGLVIVILRGRLLRPMGRLADRAQRLSRGDFTSPVPDLGRTDEVGGHADALESLRKDLLRRSLPQAPEPELAKAGKK